MSDRDLSRMGAAKVTLVMDECGHKIIEKSPTGEVEYAFYQNVATELKQAKIATPKILSVNDSLRKLRMEYIPYKVEQDAVADDDVIAMLERLHRYPPNAEWLFHTHLWSEFALEKTILLLALPEKSARLLRRFRQCSDVIFDYPSLVSGDSNAGNWGRRQNGDLVLFDWERFGKGSPAIDLGPLIKGMGTKQTFIDLAERYCQHARRHDFNALAREIAIVKAWVVTEVIMLLSERQKPTFYLYRNWYKEHLPDWLEDVAEML